MKFNTAQDESDDLVDPAMMLYVAGELDAAGRQAFEARLAVDPQLRMQVASLTEVDGLLRQNAAAKPLAAGDVRHSLNQSIRLVRQQALILKDRPASVANRYSVNLPRWAWGSAVAALLAVGFVVWVTNSEPNSITPPVAKSTSDESGPGNNGNNSWPLAGGAFAAIYPEVSDDMRNEIEAQVDAMNVIATMLEMN